MALEFEYFTPAAAGQYAFYRIPKLLISDDRFKGISTEAKLLYGILLDRVSLSLKNGWVDEQNHVYIIYTIEEIMADMNCCNRKAIKVLKELEEQIHLIEKKRQGLGKPNLIYVKNFYVQVEESQEADSMKESIPSRVKKSHFSRRKNDTSAGDYLSLTEVKKVHGINTDINKTENSNTDLILSVPGESDEIEEKYRAYKAHFIEALGIDGLIQSNPSEKEIILGILELLVDTCCSEKMLFISGEAKPASIVRARLMKLKMGHLEYVLQCLQENTSRISNMRQYLLTTLYNAPTTIGSYYRSRINYDMAAGQRGGFSE